LSPHTVDALRIFIASPGDVALERKIVKDVVEEIRKLGFIRDRLELQVYAYEDGVPPIIGKVPQSTVNKYLLNPEESDIFVCILWARMGTPYIDDVTGKFYPSGTYYEFTQAYHANSQNGTPVILLYRKDKPLSDTNVDSQQHDVEEFFNSFHNNVRKGYYKRFTEDNFRLMFRQDLLNVLAEEFGLFPGTTQATQLDKVLRSFTEASSALRTYPKHIGKSHTIVRDEPAQILEWIKSPDTDKHVALLIDQPGAGKSVALAQVQELLEKDSLAVLSIKADYISDLTSAEELQRQFNLPFSIEDCVNLVALSQPVVVLIDQLDALSISLSHSYKMLDVLHRLIMNLADKLNVRIVVSIREFDLNFDPRLSTLRRSGFKTFNLSNLTDNQIDDALRSVGVPDPSQISRAMRHLFATPLHLSIYAELVEAENAILSENFSTLHQLYSRLWELRITAAKTPYLSETLSFITHRMHRNADLAIARGTLDAEPYRQATTYLQSINFIRAEKSNYVFSHQTLFDYCFVRNLIAQDISLTDLLTTGTQGLLERSLMLQTLAYLRDSDRAEYQHQIELLLFSGKIRPLLRIHVIEWLANRVEEISDEERAVAIRLIQNVEDAQRFWEAATRNPLWFDTFGEAYVASQLAQVDKQWFVLNYLRTVITFRAASILRLIEAYVSKSPQWDEQILYCLSQLDDWNDPKSIGILCNILERRRDMHSIERCFAQIQDSNPGGGCYALRILLNYVAKDVENWVEEYFKRVPDDTQSYVGIWKFKNALRDQFGAILNRYPMSHHIYRLANAAPNSFIIHLLDWFIAVAMSYSGQSNSEEYFSDLVFGYDVYTFHEPSRLSHRQEFSFLDALVTSVRLVARNEVEFFRSIIAKLESVHTHVVQFVLVQGLLANIQELINDSFRYLMNDEKNWEVGRNSYDAYLLFRSTFLHGTAQQRLALEAKILSFYPDWEKNSEDRSVYGVTQKQLLDVVPTELLSPAMLRRKQELERKFPDFGFEPPRGVEWVATSSPITESQLEKASDDDILGAMRTYDLSTDWDAPKQHKKFGVGGIVELSRAITEQVKTQPERFYNLAQRIDQPISNRYVVAILNGLVAVQAPAQWVFDIADKATKRDQDLERPLAICHALVKYAHMGIPQNLIDTMIQWALNHKHPIEPDTDYENRNPQHRNEWLQRGINSVRGVALQCVCECLLKSPIPQTERAFELLTQGVNDASPAVGACVLDSLNPFLNSSEYRNRALQLLEDLLSRHPQLLEDIATTPILSWVSFYYFDRFGQFLEAMFNSEQEAIRQNAARAACQAALYNEQAYRLRDKVLSGDAILKRGASQTYAQYLSSSDFGDLCIDPLLMLATDDDDEVLQNVADAFATLNSDIHFEKLQTFIEAIMVLPAITSHPYRFIEFIHPLSITAHEFVLRAITNITNIYPQARSRLYLVDEALVSIALTVHSRSRIMKLREQALDIFEQLYSFKSRAALEALDKWDDVRYFKPKFAGELGT
jgi:hypothetical protein